MLVDAATRLISEGHVDSEIDEDAKALIRRPQSKAKALPAPSSEVESLRAQLADLKAQFNARPVPTVGMASDTPSVPTVTDTKSPNS
jgi:hypothetical protein